MKLTYRWCDQCADEKAFEQPPCPDGHGEDCPELACTECGFAVIRVTRVRRDTLDAAA